MKGTEAENEYIYKDCKILDQIDRKGSWFKKQARSLFLQCCPRTDLYSIINNRTGLNSRTLIIHRIQWDSETRPEGQNPWLHTPMFCLQGILLVQHWVFANGNVLSGVHLGSWKEFRFGIEADLGWNSISGMLSVGKFLILSFSELCFLHSWMRVIRLTLHCCEGQMRQHK